MARAAALGPEGSNRLSADDHAKLTTERHAADINSVSFRARLASLDRSSAAVRDRLEILNRRRAEYDVISEQLESAKNDYKVLTGAYQEIVIKTSAGQSEFRVLAEAALPQLPVSPIKIYHVLASGLVAAMMAAGLAFVLDYFHMTIFLPPAPGRRRRWARSRRVAAADGEPATVHVDGE